MLLLSSDVTNALSHEIPKASVAIGKKKLCLYHGDMSGKLRGCGLLNVVLWDGDSASGFSIAELENSLGRVKFQEKMKKLNTSEVVGLSQGDGIICLQHWEGYRTEIDAASLKVIGQQFTK